MLFSVKDAAAALGVNPQRVRAMIASNLLPAQKIGGAWALDRAAIEERLRRAPAGGRPYNAANAWKVLLAPPNAPRQRRRGIPVAKLRRRATRHRFAAHPAVVADLTDDGRVVATGVSAARHMPIDVVERGELDAYVRREDLDRLVREYGLRASGRPNVELRGVSGHWPFEPGARVAVRAAVAVDLLDAHDPRLRRAGEALANGSFVAKFFEVRGRQGNWVVGRWSDGGAERIRPERLTKAIELGTDVRYQGRMLRPADVERLCDALPRANR